jgi:hypothetical protein
MSTVSEPTWPDQALEKALDAGTLFVCPKENEYI